MTYIGKPGSEFVDVAIVQQHLSQAEEFVTHRAGPIFRSEVEGVLRLLPRPHFDSALEVLFWVWWQAYLRTSNRLDQILRLEPQVEVTIGAELFRVDFLISPIPEELSISPKWKPIAIELDGHGFHERTREQVAARDHRDRILQAAGWQVLHYSFSEFTTDPGRCITEAMVLARDQWTAASQVSGGPSAPSCF